MKRLLAILATLVLLFAVAVAVKFAMQPQLTDLDAEAAPSAPTEHVKQSPETPGPKSLASKSSPPKSLALKPKAAPALQVAQEDTSAMPTVTTTTTTHGGWTVGCTQAGDPVVKTCTATFRVFDKKTNQNLLVWVLGRNREGQLLAEFLTATEVMVQPGVVLVLDDGKPVKADYVECGSRGCKARLLLADDVLGRMKSAKKARIDMTRLDGKVIQFSIDIPGTDLALRDLGA